MNYGEAIMLAYLVVGVVITAVLNVAGRIEEGRWPDDCELFLFTVLLPFLWLPTFLVMWAGMRHARREAAKNGWDPPLGFFEKGRR